MRLGENLRWRAVPILLGLAASCCRKPATDLANTRALRIALPYDVSTLDPHAEDRVTN